MPDAPDVLKQPPNYPSSRHASHTFSHSPSVPQILAYMIVTAEILVYFLCLRQLYENYIVLGLYCGFGVIVLVSGAICSATNPTDVVVYHYKWSKLDKSVLFDTDFSQNCYCEHCDSFCANKSKHCKVCNRCAASFDHHCIWINNCVGSSNYRSFILLILVTFAHLLMFIVAGALMTIYSPCR